MTSEWRRIHADGSLSSRLVLIGEAGGEKEERAGRPFVGSSGHKLNTWWAPLGLRRSDFWIDNVFPFRPPGNDLAALLVSDYLTVHEWAANLHDRLAELTDPWLIVPTGNIALRALMRRNLDDHSITINKYRGSIMTYVDSRGRAIKMIPTVHPASIYHQRAKKARGQEKSNPGRTEKHCALDWQRIAIEAKTREVAAPTEHYYIATEAADLAYWSEEFDRLPSNVPLTIDIETPTGVVDCVGFAWDPTFSLTIPLRYHEYNGDVVTGEGHPTFGRRWALVEKICTSPNPKVLQNGPYDTLWLWVKEGIRLVNYCYELMVLHHALDPIDDHDLGYMKSVFLRGEYHKDEAKGDKAKAYADSASALFNYNGMDCCAQIALFRALVDRLIAADRWQMHEECYRPLIPILIDMLIGGINTSRLERRIANARLVAQCIGLQDQLATLVGYPLHAKKDLSRTKIQQYLYTDLKLPVQRKRAKRGEKAGSITTDEIALRKLLLKFPAPHPAGIAIPFMLQHRRALKLASFLTDAKTDSDGRLRSEIMPLTEAGRCSSKQNAFKTGCLLGSTEVLTPTGWMRLDAFPGGKVMQYEPEYGTLTWEDAVPFVQDFDGEMVRASSWFHQASYTPGHRIGVDVELRVGKIKTTTWAVEHASDLAERSVAWLPTSGEYDGPTHIHSALIRLIVATQADGSIEGSVIRFAFKKPRKIARLFQLAASAGIVMTKQKAAPGYQRFCIGARDAEPIIRRLGKDKLFGAWLLECDAETLQAFIDEIQYWDANVRGQSYNYFTVHAENAAWVQTVAHLTNRRATRRVSENRNKGSYGESSAKPLHTVAIRPVASIRLERKHWTTHEYEGNVYCVETKTGFFLCRSEETIFVTGNTNLQNQDRDPEVRQSFIPDNPNHIFLEVDCSQAESRVVYASSGDDELYALAQLPPDRFDTHSYNAHLIFGSRPEPIGDFTKRVIAPDLTTVLGYVSYEQRYFGKRVEHGAQRGMGGDTMADNLLKEDVIRTPEECTRMLEIYHTKKPGVRRYFKFVEQQILREKALTNSWGFKWDVRYEQMNADLYRRAYSFWPQSEIAFLLNVWGLVDIDGFLKMWFPEREARLVVQVHDSILISVERDANLIAAITRRLHESMTRPRPYPSPKGLRDLSIPVEFKLGANWSFSEGIEFKRVPTVDEIENALSAISL